MATFLKCKKRNLVNGRPDDWLKCRSLFLFIGMHAISSHSKLRSDRVKFSYLGTRNTHKMSKT